MSNLIIEDKKLLDMWNFPKNNNINIETVTLGSNKKVWWKCDKGHEWEALICNMSKSKDCPYCTNRKVLKGYNDLGTLFPKLAEEWDYEKNNKSPFEYSKSSEEKVWWRCNKGHSYLTRIDTRARGVECPICEGREILVGYNDIITLYPVIGEYWNYDKNIVNPQTLKIGDSNSYNWKCKKCGYEWKTRIGHIIRDFNGCRICNKGVNLENTKRITSSDLIKEWDYHKNINIDPEKISINSREKVWWICPKGHSYSSRVYSRNAGTGCPYCSNHKVLSGFNDLASLKPISLKEWDYAKNPDLTPNSILAGSVKKVHFICSKGHEYEMKVRDYYNGYNCPVCANRVIEEGINDFASFNERLLKEWNYEKNTIKPTEISAKSNEKVWWIGECGHEWQATVNSRTMLKTNCPICAEERHASVSEKSVLFYIINSQKYKEVLENYKDGKIKLELDIYIPSIKTAIEYDGERWHRNIEKDLKKDLMCEKNKIRLIRIRENGCPNYNSSSIKIYLPNNKTKGLEIGIKKVLDLLKINNNDINIERDTTEILSMINFMVKENSILITNPDIAKEWHPVKNGNLKPEHTKPGSNKKVWWICPHGHEYQLCVNARTVRGHGCPYCSSHRVMKGYNDLESQNPTLAKEWDYDRNTSSPSDVTVASGKKVWWRCSKGHEWEATISKRSNGRGSPYCSGQKVLKGYNDLATLNPTLIEEWNYNKNIDILPTEVSAHSGRKVWWKCSKCNHEWQATIDKRSNGRGCPKCKNKK